MARRPGRIDNDWETPEAPHFRWDHVAIEVLMDIREELRTLNRLLLCPNFQAIPRKLDRISANTAKPRKTKAKR